MRHIPFISYRKEGRNYHLSGERVKMEHTKGEMETRKSEYDHKGLVAEQISHVLFTRLDSTHAKALAILYNYDKESEANANRIASLWNEARDITTDEAVLAIQLYKENVKLASTVDKLNMSIDEAVRYLEHGPEMVKMLETPIGDVSPDFRDRAKDLLNHMEGK